MPGAISHANGPDFPPPWSGAISADANFHWPLTRWEAFCRGASQSSGSWLESPPPPQSRGREGPRLRNEGKGPRAGGGLDRRGAPGKVAALLRPPSTGALGHPRPCLALTHLIRSFGDVDRRNGKLAGQGGSRGYSGTERNLGSAEGSLSRRPEQAMITLEAEGRLGSVGVSCSVATGRAMVEAGLHPAWGAMAASPVLETCCSGTGGLCWRDASSVATKRGP